MNYRTALHIVGELKFDRTLHEGIVTKFIIETKVRIARGWQYSLNFRHSPSRHCIQDCMLLTVMQHTIIIIITNK